MYRIKPAKTAGKVSAAFERAGRFVPKSLFASRSSTVWPDRLSGQHGAHRALHEVMLFLEGTESPGTLGHRNVMGRVRVAGVCCLLGLAADLRCTPRAASTAFLEDDQDSLEEREDEFQGPVWAKFSHLFPLGFICIQAAL